ncbi:MAG: type II toxin-antitoxin system prevent-host-death family antitoxin [Clostridiaceae bacterium]|jgi:prevent-host-death family protein|nr:type II toxin-antitoxin system prevent-host-death family antitoxin [Clostridiales bacterium]MDD2441131.1 type II toxin-antitoxin system prevent-host-death family antitoxin [Eubacteriales bacterium]NLB43901.1 type II toxin-antitoxin system prevent-host-death family antitoxin [Clostridiaceae bacterium]NLC83797.1 type II toxin-antitoxin system prevent-host-death family antitoxin [Oscillospiraceae bacterium]MDD4140342.1 type II toxin-antitoxin system prevent-host-death family antitoxin [Eubacter
MIVTATQLKNNLGKYLEIVHKEDSIIVTKNGEPIAKIVPFIVDKKAALDSLVGLLPDTGLSLDEIKAERLSKQ